MRAAVFSLLSAILLLVPAPGAAQTCGLVPGVSAAGGYVHYPVAGGTSGAAIGGELAVEVRPAVVQLGYRRMLLEGDGADPDVARAVVAYPAYRLAGLDLCAVGHAGVTRFTLDSDAGWLVAGGIGATLASADGPLQPYVSVRGLGARTVGTVLGLDVEASGLSLGVEAGLAAVFGPAALRLSGTVDGFDDGLGVTPYPGQSAELALQIRF